MKFSHPLTVRLYDTDAAGILYFPQLFRFVQTCFETWISERGFPISAMLTAPDFLIVVVRCDGDYLAPVKLGDALTVELTVERVGTASFTLHYEILRSTTVVGRAKVVYCCVDRVTQGSRVLPDSIRAVLTDGAAA